MSTTQMQNEPPAKSSKQPTTKILGSELAFDPKKHERQVERSYWYWIGALPGMPIEHVEIGGQCFPKMEEHITRGAVGETVRAPVIGALVRLTADNVRRIRDRLPRTVVRWRDEDADERSDREGLEGVGQSVDAVLGEPRRRKGYLITIPTESEIAARRAAGRPANLYQARAGDEPASRYLFAQRCTDQSRPGRGDHYPMPLEATGIEFPDSID